MTFILPLSSEGNTWERSKVKTIGIIGCGAIGTLIGEAAEKGIVPCDRLILYDLDKSKAEKLRKSVHLSTIATASVDEMIQLKPTVIVEAASQQAVREYVDKIVCENIELIVMSVGALLGMNVRSKRIHIPSGAIGGLDAISSADLAGVDEVVLTTRKNPEVLDSDNREEKLIYEGDAEEAVKRFPREMNVAATLALTVQPEKLKVRVVSDPKTHRNVHEIRVKWKHGEMLLQFLNDPHPKNPETSALSAWSAIRLLKQVLENPSSA
jgi:aspartate dehydrogenase